MSRPGANRRRSTLNTLFSRRTIRVFRQGGVSSGVVRLMVEAGQRAPCSYQTYSVIQITRSDLRDKIAEITGEELVRKAPILLLLCIDVKRASTLFESLTRYHIFKSGKHPVETVEAILEAGLFLENVIIAAEVMGLGSVILDSALVYAREVAETLRLPRGVVPLVFLCVGQPAEKPPLRPRLPLELVFHVDGYREPRVEELRAYLESASERLGREGYLLKYANMRKRYIDYLTEKVKVDRQTEKVNNSISDFLHHNGLKI